MKIGLGTAQFGSHYGISNKEGTPTLDEVKNIIDLAYKAGIKLLDTAPAYGVSENVIGNVLSKYKEYGFKIVTKTPVFKSDDISGNCALVIESTFRDSLAKLKQERLYGLLIHHCDDLFRPNGEFLYKKMVELKGAGLVEKIGVSIYAMDQIDRTIKHYPIDIIQAPLNVFDQRLINSGHLVKAKMLGIEIHIRSTFLQGLLLMEPSSLPSYFDKFKHHINEYHDFLNRKGLSPVAAALLFVMNYKDIDHVIVGVNCESDLEDILSASSNPIEKIDFSSFAIDDDFLLNPSWWYN